MNPDTTRDGLLRLIQSAQITGDGSAHVIAEVVRAAGWTPPAATPGRDELREQIAAALIEMRRRTWAFYLDIEQATDAVLPVVDAWVAAHTAEKRRDWSNLPAALKVRFEDDEPPGDAATVAQVRALCDEIAAARHHPEARYGMDLVLGRVRAALDPEGRNQ